MRQSPTTHPQPTRHPPAADTTQQTRRARDLVHLGELSAVRQALLSGPLAPGAPNAPAELRPTQPYHPIPPDVSARRTHRPPCRVACVKPASRPERQRPVPPLSRSLMKKPPTDSSLLPSNLAVAKSLPPVASLLGLGRLGALQKPNGGLRGLVIGDVLRRLVARSWRPNLMPHKFRQLAAPGNLICSLCPSWRRSGHQSLGWPHPLNCNWTTHKSSSLLTGLGRSTTSPAPACCTACFKSPLQTDACRSSGRSMAPRRTMCGTMQKATPTPSNKPRVANGGGATHSCPHCIA